ncbi:unnamed protein product [Cylindrotheca closterium]|uniref:Uncharacterized protein n=1 Tax=Cylindrotheca closterium TaxID=2856 RepID=A0AAD2PXX8_9STRA|nr:unnamed protein product [Cylindrotheca closterium]
MAPAGNKEMSHAVWCPDSVCLRLGGNYKGTTWQPCSTGGQWNGIIGKLINTHDTTSKTCTSLAPLFPIQGMLTKVFIPKYCKQGKGKSLLQFLHAIQCTPAVKKPPSDKPEQPAKQDANSPDAPLLPPAGAPASQEPTPTNQRVTAPPTTVQPTLLTPSTKRSSRKESKKSQSKKPIEKPTETSPTPPKPPSPESTSPTPQSATNPPTKSSARAKLSASEQATITEAFNRSAWLAAMDAELNQGPAGLFQLILPGPIDGFYVFVVRQKFASLAQEVLKKTWLPSLSCTLSYGRTYRKKKTINEKHQIDQNFANGLCSLSTRVYIEIAEVFINSTAFHCFTMGKYTSLKVVSTTANKAGGSTFKSVSVAKKSRKKRLENPSAVDLRQPKDCWDMTKYEFLRSKYKVFDTYDRTLIVMLGFDANLPDNLYPHEKGKTLYKWNIDVVYNINGPSAAQEAHFILFWRETHLLKSHIDLK